MYMFNLLNRLGILGILLLGIAGCSVGDPTAQFNDPYEERNRKVHENAKKSDKRFVKPVAMTVSGALGPEVNTVIGNVVDNLSLPGQAVNSLLQGDIKNVGIVSMRFAVNSTLGMAGIGDPASELKLRHDETDFGETLHVWGAREGAYLVLPVIGPTTERDVAGMIVDAVIDPVGYVLSTDAKIAKRVLGVTERLDDRAQYNNLIEDVYYGSADSYAAMRLYYLQTRRRALNGEVADIDLEDPYAQ